ncbi:hypothetical protein Lser_V15G37193 [Lactuca serriola]
MSSSRNDQPSNETPILHIDTATFQTAVTAAVVAAVTAVLAHHSAISTVNVVDGNGVSNRGIHPGSRQTVTVIGSQSQKAENKKRKRQARKERKRSQNLAIQQQQVETPAVPVPRKPYEGKLPKCDKCSFHHHGTCHVMQCCNCLNIGHHARSCGAPARPITQVLFVGTNPAHNVSYNAERFKKQFSKWSNEKGTRVHITLAKHRNPVTKASTSQSFHQCGEVGHFKKDCPITKNLGVDRKILRITGAGEPTLKPSLL